MIVLIALAAGAAVAVVLGSATALIAVALLPVLLLVGNLAGIVGALVVGISIHRIEIGVGRPLRDVRWGRLHVLLRLIPVGASWLGTARGHSWVRTRFIVAHLAGLIALAVLSTVALWRPPWQGLGVSGLVTLACHFLPWQDAYGHSNAGWQILTIPRMKDVEIVTWSHSRLGGLAIDAAHARKDQEALRWAEQALQQDPDDQAALTAKGLAAEHTGDTGSALAAAERLAGQSAGGHADLSARIADQGNLAWALILAAETDVKPDDWEARALDALAEAEALSGRLWELDSSWALLHVLRGRPTTAHRYLEAPLAEALDSRTRASVLLTLARVRHGLGDHEEARDALTSARELCPDSPRIAIVERALLKPPPR